jgi:Uma2 family endonuclease
MEIDEYSQHYQFELADGRLQVKEPPDTPHGAAQANLTALLGMHVRQYKLGKVYGEVAFLAKRNPDTVRGPDAAFVRAERIAQVEKQWLREADLIIEIISPSNTKHLMEDKLRNYIGAGARLVWYVDPAKKDVTVHRPDGSKTVLTGDDVLSGEHVVDGFTCRVSEIFE